MQKRREIFIVVGFILVTAFFSLIVFYSGSHSITGFAILISQPNITDGKDTYLRELSETNYGDVTELRLGTVTTGGGRELRSILYFNLSSIPSENTVISADLSIYISSSSTNNTITVNAYRLTSNWTENNANWYNRTQSTNWTSDGGDYNTQIFNSSLITNETGWVNFSIDLLARNWVNGTYENLGLMLYAPDATPGDSKDFYSSNYTSDPTLIPKLTIEHVGNAPPSINTLTSNSSQSTPTPIGDNILFTLNWTDLENDNSKIYICNSSNITVASGCGDTTFCSTSLASTNIATCSYTTLTTDNRTTSFWAAVCDTANCSSISAENYFYINHNPAISLTQPNGGETVNQSLGNYSILFSVNDTDSDNLTATLYYGATSGSTTNTIASNINLSNYCTDADNDTATTNTCSYSWNSTGIYGAYYMTIVINDSYTTTNDTSDATFNAVSIVDIEAPQITSTSIDSGIYSGKTTTVNATITDGNIITAWVDLNYTATNVSMTNTSLTAFTITFAAPAIGTYAYRVHASDIVGNLNNSLSWQEFNVTKPNATAQNTQAPSVALPYNTVVVTSQLNATDAPTGVYAYLNAPAGFTFLGDYPQNQALGDFTTGQTKNATWFLSVPITESTYTLNVTYTDGYSNQWNSSSVSIQVTSAISGGYVLDITGYPEVETSGTYYVESKFKQDATYTAPDSITINIYDAAGSQVVGPVAMTEESTGQHNYTYTVGASATEGQWESVINATRSSTSYFANQFWKVVGGPFDVRNITVLNSSINNLIINVTTENTGGANKDLTLEWNLTVESNGTLLDSGADTFMVPASSTRLWTVNPTTTFVGQVRITMLGFYSQTEKAGAYEVFSTTTSGLYCGDGTCNNGESCSTCSADCGSCTTPDTGGGGGGTVTVIEEKAELIFQNLPETIELATGIEKIVAFTINNTGTIDLTNLILNFENLSSKYYSISPLAINTLKPGETKKFFAKFLISDFSGSQKATIKITSNQIDITQPITINVLNMRDYLISELERLREKIDQLKQKLTDEEKPTLVEELKTCEDILSKLENNIRKEEFINANNNIKETEDCIQDIEDKSPKLKKIPFTEIQMISYWVWIITWSLILILIAIIIIITRFLYKKIKLLSFVKGKQSQVTTQTKPTREKEFIEDKLKRIKENLG